MRVCLMAAALVLAASCASPKKFVYLQDMETGKQYPINEEAVTIVHVNDRLDIKVSCRNPELAVPFNSQVGAYKMSIDGGVSEARTETVESGYRVDADGNIVTSYSIPTADDDGGEETNIIETAVQTVRENPEILVAPTGIVAVGSLAGFFFSRKHRDSVIDEENEAEETEE